MESVVGYAVGKPNGVGECFFFLIDASALYALACGAKQMEIEVFVPVFASYFAGCHFGESGFKLSVNYLTHGGIFGSSERSLRYGVSFKL